MIPLKKGAKIQNEYMFLLRCIMATSWIGNIYFINSNALNIANNVADIANNSDHIDYNSFSIHLIADHLDNATRCTAINWYYTCCTSANPCGIGQGKDY